VLPPGSYLEKVCYASTDNIDGQICEEVDVGFYRCTSIEDPFYGCGQTVPQEDLAYCPANCPPTQTSLGGYRCTTCGTNQSHCCTSQTCNQGLVCHDDLFICVPEENNSNPISSVCNDQEGYIFTAIGCIPYNFPARIASFFINWAIGVGGGLALAMTAVSAFKIMTSQGDPQRLQTAKDLLTAALSGLFMIVFSAFVLRLIGINTLGLF